MEIIKDELKVELREFTFRKEKFTILFHYFIDEKESYEYTTNELNGINLNQVYNAYRTKYLIPFTTEILTNESDN